MYKPILQAGFNWNKLKGDGFILDFKISNEKDAADICFRRILSGEFYEFTE